LFVEEVNPLKRKLKRILILCLVLMMTAPTALAYNKLKKGASGAEVTRMQSALQSLGYAIKADGKFGAGTESTVKTFQRDFGLQVDGVAGNKTLTLLYSLVPGEESASPTPTAAAAAGGSTPAPGALTAWVSTSNGGSLKFRAKPSTASNVAVYDYIPNGTALEVVSYGATWCIVKYNGWNGYVMTEYLHFASAPAVTAAPAATATPRPAVTAAPAQSSGLTAVVMTANGGSLNLRSTAKSGNNIILSIPYGSRLTVTQRGSTWSAVVYNGISGYVMTSYLLFGSEATAAPVLTQTPAPTQAPAGTTYAYVTTANGKALNLRSAPDASQNNVMLEIPNGTLLTVTARGSTWCAVTYNGRAGYVMTSFLSFPGQSAATATPTPAAATPVLVSNVTQGFVNTSNGGSLNLRSSPSDRAGVIAQMPNGAALTVTSRGSDWCGVIYNGIAGYAMTKFLYIPIASATSVPATATPAPLDGSVYTRVLRSGCTGSDVRWAQSRLLALGYSVTVTGTYDAATVSAVKAFQSKNGLTSDGLVGEQTHALLASDYARKASDGAVSYSTLRIDSTDSGVLSMQQALLKLGYNLKATGEFDVATHNAVVAFQQRNGLVISGIADGLTRTVIMSGQGKPYSTPVEELPSDAGRIAGPSRDEIKLMHWQNEIKPKVKAGETILIYDPQTGLSWNLVFYSLGRHADSQPVTWRDTQIMNRSFGSTSWTIHPVYVKLPTGEWTIATMHNRPHLYGSITNNGFGGHLCVHFLRTMSEAQANDPDYGVSNQKTLRNAWKALTGEDINY